MELSVVNAWSELVKPAGARAPRTAEGGRLHTSKACSTDTTKKKAKRTVRSPRDCPPNPPG